MQIKAGKQNFCSQGGYSSRASYGSRVREQGLHLPRKPPSAPAPGQQTSQQHQKDDNASESLRMVKLHGLAGNSTVGTGNLHGMSSKEEMRAARHQPQS